MSAFSIHKIKRYFAESFLIGILSTLLIAGCNTHGLMTVSDGRATAPITLTVSAAASLQDALEAIAPQFSAAHPNIAVAYNFGASGALQQQIEQGAPADVFFPAATNQMNALADKGLILSSSRQALLTNSLVLIAPIASSLNITDLSQLETADISHFAVGEFRSVPAGQYAEQAFKQLALLDSLQSKFVFGNTVRSVLAAVGSGNAELGMVYVSDAQLSDQVKVLVTVPPGAHPPIVYPIAALKSTPHPAAAQTFINFLTTEMAQATFQAFGFDPGE